MRLFLNVFEILGYKYVCLEETLEQWITEWVWWAYIFIELKNVDLRIP